MYKLLIILLLLLIAGRSSAQTAKDTLIYNLPVINNKLIYEGNGKTEGRNKADLDSLLKNWIQSYFNLHKLTADQATIIPANNDTTGVILSQGILEYKVRPGMVNIDFVAIIRIKVLVTDGWYSYKIDRIFFRPKNGTLNAMGYQNDPEYLIREYKKKHIGFWTAWNVTRKQMREYLSTMNAAIRSCISSLNNTMTK